MESHNEYTQSTNKNGQKQAYIDFYRHVDQHNEYGDLKQNTGNENFRTTLEPAVFNNQISGDNTPVSRSLQHKQDPRNKNFGENRLQDAKAIANKRRSIENKESLKQHDNRNLISGARSALNNYGTGNGQQNIKKIDRELIEKDPMVNNFHQQQLQQQVQNQMSNSISQQSSKAKSLAKSQSQNRLLLVSSETMINKNPHYQNMYEAQDVISSNQDKNSFFKDQLSGDKLQRIPHQPSELLYKQHMQNSNSTTQKAWQLKAKSNKLLSHITTKDCTYCNKTGVMLSQSTMNPTHVQCCSAMYCQKDSQGLMIQNNLSKKYSTNRDYYNLKIVNDLIYNENTHVVSIFKDYLILDDINEFLKRTYTVQETKVRLPKLCTFYDKYSQVFPNYVCLPESKYMFKNIQRKQKLIDEQYQLQEELAKKQHQTLLDDDKLFNSRFYNSVYKSMDLSMTRQQYEDQAKQIANKNQRLLKINEMKIDELVDRFLMKDSESNIQLITTAGLDFSGFTQHSQFLDNTKNTPQQNVNAFAKVAQTQQTAMGNNKQSVIQLQNNKRSSQVGTDTQIKKGNAVLDSKKTSQPMSQPTDKRQKGSFNNQQTKQMQVPKMETVKVLQQSSNQTGSTKNTPRIQKATQLTIQGNETNKQQMIQTSPATKEAIQSYLQQCQIDGGIHSDKASEQAAALLQLQILSEQGDPLLSPQFNPGTKLLMNSGSQSTLSQNNHYSLQHSRQQMMKSVIPTINLGSNKEITNLKKSTTTMSTNRLSSSGNANTHHLHQKSINTKSNISPLPQTTTTLQLSQSRNNLVQNSTHKSVKSVNSHTKYLSGGNDQYQRLLQQQQQNSYQTQDTINSRLMSSGKKQQSSKHEILYKQRNAQQQIQQQQQQQVKIQEDENVIFTGEDCDEGGIADERFASPGENGIIFGQTTATMDEQLNRKSVERPQSNLGNNQFLLTSQEDKLLSQCNNFEQIKKHLEKYINNNQQQTFDNQQIIVNSYDNTDSASSRNGTAQKQFESLKQKIRGAFDNGNSTNEYSNKQSQQSSHHQNQVKQKTPSKNLQGSNSKTGKMVMNANQRMSLEPKDIVMGANHGYQGVGQLSSTSANGRTLSFSQSNNPNYRSITNLQQRKNSSNKQTFNQHHQEQISAEQKRLTQGLHNRQSFKELHHHEKIIKRCATGKTLSINDAHHTFGNIINPNQNNNLYPQTSTNTLCNPTFIQSNGSNNRLYQTSQSTQQQQQQYAANSVRVMTPSYSLASLGGIKMVSPHGNMTGATQSPLTMTVTLGPSANGSTQINHGRKQKLNAHQHNPSSLSQQNQYILTSSDKNQNRIISSKQHISNNKKTTMNTKTNQIQMVSNQQNKIKPQLQQSNSLQQLQITPRGQLIQQQANPTITLNQQRFYNQLESSNLSCTISTENNSTAKAIESKHPKFMKTIEEYSQPNQQQQSYNNMLSASMGANKKQTGLLTSSISQAQFELKQKQKIQTVVNSNQTSIKRTNGGAASTLSLTSSASVSNFKSPNIHQQTRKQTGGRYM